MIKLIEFAVKTFDAEGKFLLQHFTSPKNKNTRQGTTHYHIYGGVLEELIKQWLHAMLFSLALLLLFLLLLVLLLLLTMNNYAETVRTGGGYVHRETTAV